MDSSVNISEVSKILSLPICVNNMTGGKYLPVSRRILLGQYLPLIHSYSFALYQNGDNRIWISNYGYEKTKDSVYTSLEKLHTDYLDLLLLHQPFGDYYSSYRASESFVFS